MISKLFKRKKRLKSSLNFFETVFHGDKYLIDVVDFLIKDREYFIETGTNVGSTLAYVARKYPSIKCFSCEPDKIAYKNAKKNTHGYDNVMIYNLTSQKFLVKIKNDCQCIYEKKILFWLDAHGYGFKWPLMFEIEFITKYFNNVFILIDDFKVPGLDCFGFDSYKDQICSFDYIKNAINTDNYNLYYPNYCERTSKHHPLRGWGLISLGKYIDFPNNIKNFINSI